MYTQIPSTGETQSQSSLRTAAASSKAPLDLVLRLHALKGGSFGGGEARPGLLRFCSFPEERLSSLLYRGPATSVKVSTRSLRKKSQPHAPAVP